MENVISSRALKLLSISGLLSKLALGVPLLEDGF